MRPSDRSLTVGLCVSLLLHAVVLYTALGQYIRDMSHVYLSPSWTHARPAAADVAMFNSPNAFGEDQGQGQSAQSETGDRPLIAPDGDQVQALLSREAQGPRGQPGARSPSQDPANQNPAAPANAAAPTVMTPALADTASPPPRPQSPPIPMPAPSAPAAPPLASSPTLVGTTPSPASKPSDAQSNQTALAMAPPHDPTAPSPTPASPTPPSPTPASPAPKPPSPASPSPTPSSPPTSPSPPATPHSSAPAAPNPPTPAAPAPGGGGGGGSPVPPSNSESDPFDSSISVTVRPGSVDAHTGRKVRTVRPDLTLAAETDLMTAGGGRVQLAVRLDPSGNVTDVKVLASSGFPDDVDLPCVQAMHQWWIEPTKDKAGHPISDEIIITITFQ